MPTPTPNEATTPAGARRCADIPETMKALQYSAAETYAVVEIPVPEVGDDDVLVKISACGVCGTDLHYHKGEFLAKWPLIPGHEATGTIAALGRNVSHLPLSAPVTADPMQPCRTCFHCTHRNPLLCTSLTAYGGNVPGGFAQYCVYAASQVHLLPRSLPPLEAVLIEPAACALHGIERMRPAPGDRVLLFGSGPTGLLLAQLVRMNGAAHLTIAAKEGVKLDAARGLGVADCVVAISEDDAEGDFRALLERNPHGFDVVVEATGAPSVLERSVEFVRKGGKLIVYGVYDDKVKVAWSPFTIWEKEMTILASFCSMQHMPQVLEYVRAGRLKMGGVVDRTFRIEEWAECMEVVRKGECVKAAIVFD